MWPPWATIESEQVFARCSSIELQGTFQVLSPEKFLLVGRDYSQTRCLLQPIAGAMWLPFLLPGAGITLEWFWPLSGLLAHCQAFGLFWLGCSQRLI